MDEYLPKSLKQVTDIARKAARKRDVPALFLIRDHINKNLRVSGRELQWKISEMLVGWGVRSFDKLYPSRVLNPPIRSVEDRYHRYLKSSPDKQHLINEWYKISKILDDTSIPFGEYKELCLKRHHLIREING